MRARERECDRDEDRESERYGLWLFAEMLVWPILNTLFLV